MRVLVTGNDSELGSVVAREIAALLESLNVGVTLSDSVPRVSSEEHHELVEQLGGEEIKVTFVEVH